MNLQRSSRILATGAVALALIGGGVGAAFTDHWSGTQNAVVGTIIVPPPTPLLTITSNSQGAVVNPVAKTVTFADYAVTTPASDPMFGGAYDQLSITTTGTGILQVSATVTSNMPAAELAKFVLNDGVKDVALSATPLVIATRTGVGSINLGLEVNWAGLTAAASGYTLTVTYSIDAG